MDGIFVKGNAGAVYQLLAPDFTSHTFPSTGSAWSSGVPNVR